uniref:Guanine nucleotide-binding protein subunit beta-like protein n=1 Tax=Eutreptiella gymnastica TaxID=73025 RepID=A0A7S4GA44_9EUGL
MKKNSFSAKNSFTWKKPFFPGPFHKVSNNLSVLTNIFQFIGYKEEIMPIRRVCKTWAKLMLTDDVWEVTLRADMFMYHKWLEYEDQRMLTKDNPMQPLPKRSLHDWYKWRKHEMADQRELQSNKKALEHKAVEEDSMFNKHFSKNKRVEKLDSKKTEEQQKSITELIRSTVLVYTDIVSLTHFVDSSSKKLTLALGCADGKMLLADPHELIPTNTDPSAIPTFNTVDEHDGAIVAMLVTKTYLFTCSTDCTCAVYSLDMLTRPKVILIGHSEEVTCVAAHRSDENIIVTGSLDRQVLIWNVAESNKPTHVCRGHSMKICCLQVTEDRIFSGSRDSSVHVWDWKGRLLRVLTGHLGPIVGLQMISVTSSIHDTAYRIISCDGAGKVSVWNATSCRLLSSSIVVNSGVCLAVQQNLGLLAVGAFDGTIAIRDLQTDASINLIFHTRAVRFLYCSDVHLYSSGDDWNLCVWEWSEVSRLLDADAPKPSAKPSAKKARVPVTVKPFRVLQHTTFLAAMFVKVFTTTSRLAYIVTTTTDKRYHVWKVASSPKALDAAAVNEKALPPEKAKVNSPPIRKGSIKHPVGKKRGVVASPASTSSR